MVSKFEYIHIELKKFGVLLHVAAQQLFGKLNSIDDVHPKYHTNTSFVHHNSRFRSK